MIIVIEGPDNAGKTTLAMALAKRIRAAFVKVERPAKGSDLLAFHEILEVASGYSGKVVADRHVAISEPIYGSILRGGHGLEKLNIEMCLSRLQAIVYCRPPMENILATIGDRPQMPGVVNNAQAIVRAYDEFFDSTIWGLGLKPPFQYHYDYTRDTVDGLIERIDMGVRK